MKTLTQGLHYDVAAADYFADPAPEPSLTQSLCKVLLDQSVAHARAEHPKLAPPPDEDEDPDKYVKAQAIGNAAHAILIGRGKEIAVADFDNWRGKDASKFKTDAVDAGKTPTLSKHMATAYHMVKAARVQLDAAGWTEAFNPDAGNGEVVAIWQEGGIWFRTMIDFLTNDRCRAYDLKSSAASFAPHIIGRKMVDDGWDIQAAMHERALNALDPKNAGRRKFRFAPLENYPPYAMNPVELTEAWLTMGRKKLEMAIELWREAVTSGRFDGYPLIGGCPQYPGHRETEWLGREVAHADRPKVGKMINSLAGG